MKKPVVYQFTTHWYDRSVGVMYALGHFFVFLLLLSFVQQIIAIVMFPELPLTVAFMETVSVYTLIIAVVCAAAMSFAMYPVLWFSRTHRIEVDTSAIHIETSNRLFYRDDFLIDRDSVDIVYLPAVNSGSRHWRCDLLYVLTSVDERIYYFFPGEAALLLKQLEKNKYAISKQEQTTFSLANFACSEVKLLFLLFAMLLAIGNVLWRIW